MSPPKSSFCPTIAQLLTPLTWFAVAGLACDSGATRVAAPSSSPLAPASAATTPALEGRADCRFQRPQPWSGGRTEWLGGCRSGFADGSGVLVNMVEGAEPDRFYGRLDSGSPSIGVLQTEGGYVAGRWHDGALAAALPDDMAQRNVLIDAFREGAKAATATSQSFADKSDNDASAFYATQARLLGDQMD